MPQRLGRVSSLAGLALASGCSLFNSGTSSGTGGGTTPVAWTSPQLEVTIAQNDHFGPGLPTGSATLVNQRDVNGDLLSGSLTINATVASANCALSFSRADGGIGVGQYKVSAEQQGDGYVYPQSGESISTPGGNGLCNGSDCDGDTLVLSEADAAHIYGYFMAGDPNSPVICSFWLPLTGSSP